MTSTTAARTPMRPGDLVGFDGLLSTEERAIRDTVKAFAGDHIRPYIGDWYDTATFPHEIIKELGRLGVLGMHLEGYGCAGTSLVSYGLACMELEAADCGIRSFVSVQGSLAMSSIHRYGSEAQKHQWLPATAAGEAVGCFGLTEPDFGSNPAGIRTHARRDGDDWVLNGSKMWITNGGIADIAVVWAPPIGAVAVGDAGLVIAGGVESMTRAPCVVPKPDRAFPVTGQTMYSTALGWRMENPAMPAEWRVSLCEAPEQLAEKYGIDREAQEVFASGSHRKADAAWAAGVFADEVVAVRGVDLGRDESICPTTTPESLARLKPAFRDDGTVTAGNASPLNDGAAVLLMGGQRAVERLARIVARTVVGIEPQFFGAAPVEAAERAPARAGIEWDDLSFVELNEAFAAQSLAWLSQWPELDTSIVNVHGGAIALSHPLCAPGARIVGHFAGCLHERGSGFGLAAICIGVGQGLAMELEAC